MKTCRHGAVLLCVSAYAAARKDAPIDLAGDGHAGVRPINVTAWLIGRGLPPALDEVSVEPDLRASFSGR